MIKYGKILLMHEKDNPSSILRKTYLFSNVGDLVKCYGRSIRFPEDKRLYEAEMKLAIADILMQCRMALEEKGYSQIEIDNLDTKNEYIEKTIRKIVQLAANAFVGTTYIPETLTRIILECYILCDLLGENGQDIEHLGFCHVMERFNEFERRGWQ